MTNSPLEALLNKMSSMQEKAYCVFEYAKTSSVTVVQRHFCTKFRKEPPHRHNISSSRRPAAYTRTKAQDEKKQRKNS
ncbi:hypothetical protein TNCV_264911 [Trichonephila clavipes]|nr:hypothetical protein TNCV_264911 [Trichonephila clavipes]